MGFKTILKQPQAFYFVFLIEILERFSYYGVSVVLLMYALNILGLPPHLVSTTFAAFLVFVFLPLFIGGYVNDRFIGDKKGVLLGAILLMSGYGALALSNGHALYFALGLILVGNLFFKVAAPSLLAKIVTKETRSLDSVFTMYYMAINVGSFLGMLLFPQLVRHHGFSMAFTLAAFNIFLVVLLTFGFYNVIPEEQKGTKKIIVLVLALALIGAGIFSQALRMPLLARFLYALIGLFAVWTLAKMFLHGMHSQRAKLWVITVLMAEALIYFIPNWYAPFTLSFFVSHFCDGNIFGFEINPHLFQILNPFWIFVCSPILAYYYNVRASKGKDMNITSKFALGIMFCGIGFLLLPAGYYFREETGLISADWAVFSYLFLALGELLVSGLGLAMIARLAKPAYLGMLMGAWYLTTPIAIGIGHSLPEMANLTSPLANLEAVLYLYSRQFFILGIIVFVLSLCMFAFSDRLSAIAHIQKSATTHIKNAIQVTESLSSKLSKQVSRHLLAIGVIVALIILVGAHNISKRMYDTQVNNWITHFEQSAAASTSFDYQSELITLRTSQLFSSFVVMDPQYHVIAGFGLKTSAITGANQPTGLVFLQNVDRHKVQPILGTNGALLGYYTYVTDYDDYFIPFLWLTAVCLLALICLYFVFKNVLRYSFKRELKNMGLFLEHIEALTRIMKTTDEIKLNPPAHAEHHASEEEVRINKILSELIAEINISHHQIKEITQQAEKDRALKELANTAAQVAHDIRSPLTALNSCLKRLPQIPENDRILMRNAANRINDIANNLLQQHKGGDRLTESYRVWLLAPLVESIISEKRAQFEGRALELDSEISSAGFAAFAQFDATEMKRLLSNLINNALDAFDAKGGKVTVLLDADEGNLFLTVKDNGCGIPEDQLNAVLEPGVSLKAKGNGLGLPHAKKTVEDWGGSFALSSVLGEGTQVKLNLVRSRTPAWFVSSIEVSEERPVAILDDDASVHDAWDQRLREVSEGLQVHHFRTTQDFMNWYQTQEGTTQIFSDYELLGDPMTGLEALEKMDCGKNAILVTSHYENPEIMERCQKRGIRLLPKNLLAHVPMLLKKTAVKKPVAVLKKYDLILLDDLDIVTEGWEMSAMLAGKDILTFNTIEDFEEALEGIDPSTPIYIDSELGNGIKGEEYAEGLFHRGFKELYLATGHDADHFGDLPWIKGIVGKEPVF